MGPLPFSLEGENGFLYRGMADCVAISDMDMECQKS